MAVHCSAASPALASRLRLSVRYCGRSFPLRPYRVLGSPIRPLSSSRLRACPFVSIRVSTPLRHVRSPQALPVPVHTNAAYRVVSVRFRTTILHCGLSTRFPSPPLSPCLLTSGCSVFPCPPRPSQVLCGESDRFPSIRSYDSSPAAYPIISPRCASVPFPLRPILSCLVVAYPLRCGYSDRLVTALFPSNAASPFDGYRDHPSPTLSGLSISL